MSVALKRSVAFSPAMETRNLSLTARIRVRDPDGTQRVMGEDERQRRIEEAQQGIVTNCGAADAG